MAGTILEATVRTAERSTSPGPLFLGYVREKQTSVLFKPLYSGASLSQQLSLHLNSYSRLHGCPLHLLPF